MRKKEIDKETNVINEGTYPISLESMPKDNLYLSQVVDFLNEEFPQEKFTSNIIQNYIKSEIVSRPYEGKKRGYTKDHIIQLVLLSYMRPILSTDEIKEVISFAFNEINKEDDDLITWSQAYEVFLKTYRSFENYNDINKDLISTDVEEFMGKLKVNDSVVERLKIFLEVIILVTRAGIIKKNARKLITDYRDKL